MSREKKLKLNSMGSYVKNRVMSGHSPHRLLKMIQRLGLKKNGDD